MSLRHEKRIVFFGTPDFAVPSLAAIAAHFSLCGVVTQPDKPVGRKKVLTPPPIHQSAVQYAVPILQPEKLSLKHPEGEEFFAQLKELQPDCIVVVAYGKILPEHILSLAPFGCINVHPSLLPEFRGATPMQAAILHGNTHTGTTIMRMDAGMDTGPILAQEGLDISHTIAYPELERALGVLSAELLVPTLQGYFAGTTQPQPQNNANATYCDLISREDGLVSVDTPSSEVDRKFRAYTPWPGIYLFHHSVRIKILDGALHPQTGRFEPSQVQREGKNPQPYTQFCKQYPELAFRFTA